MPGSVSGIEDTKRKKIFLKRNKSWILPQRSANLMRRKDAETKHCHEVNSIILHKMQATEQASQTFKGLQEVMI